MANEDLVRAEDFCMYYKADLEFIHSLNDAGLIELVVKEQTVMLPVQQLHQLERMTRFYYEMDINVQGIEVIQHLLQRMQLMEYELQKLRNEHEWIGKEA